MVSHVHRLNDHEPKQPDPATLEDIAQLLVPIAKLATAILDEREAKTDPRVETLDPEPATD
jgi:hypothetical protein